MADEEKEKAKQTPKPEPKKVESSTDLTPAMAMDSKPKKR